MDYILPSNGFCGLRMGSQANEFQIPTQSQFMGTSMVKNADRQAQRQFVVPYLSRRYFEEPFLRLKDWLPEKSSHTKVKRSENVNSVV